eukprot:scaffold1938_cov278-Chaetoceros_neogracile.AAC.17
MKSIHRGSEIYTATPTHRVNTFAILGPAFGVFTTISRFADLVNVKPVSGYITSLLNSSPNQYQNRECVFYT